MGVHGLWDVVKPCARPIRIETLNKKRLAVDASIWIYQFLKAVRDKEGNALRNAHVVGFFRRICKLLYFGIKPVFVFDGGAPELKRQTIAARRRRREGRQDDASRTAERLLAIQLQKKAEEEVARSRRNPAPDEEEPLPQELVYAEETFLSQKERQRNRQFRKKDAYHLPELEGSLEEMGAPNDPRIMSHEELEEYARQFHSGESLNLYDFSKIDFDSPFFLSLPAADRYNILNAARLRSRLRMGYSKDQLDSMFPNRMEFSRFQIQRVAERNDLTQRLMNINGMNGENGLYDLSSSTRIASERNKEYVLVKDNSVEGGWALGVLGNKGQGQRDKPIDVEEYGRHFLSDDRDENMELEDEEDAFEDVPIEGLNRLPKLPAFQPGIFDRSIESEIRQRRQAAYPQHPAVAAAQAHSPDQEIDELFVGVEPQPSTARPDLLFDEFQEVDSSDDEALRQAIQLSLEFPMEDDAASAALPDGGAIAEASRVSGHDTERVADLSDSDENDMDLFSALSKSKVTKSATEKKPPPHRFDGLLPFEPLKTWKPAEPSKLSEPSVHADAGGFDPSSSKGKEKPMNEEPMPPWFTEASQKGLFINHEADDEFSGIDRYRNDGQKSILSKFKPSEVIDLEDSEPVSESASAPPDGKFPSDDSVIAVHDKGAGEEKLDDAENAMESPPKEASSVGDKGPRGVSAESEQWPASEPDHANTEPQQPLRESSSPEFEEVPIQNAPQSPKAPSVRVDENEFEQEDIRNQATEPFREEGGYSDPEDDELLHQLSLEAEEHARFATSINSTSRTHSAQDYEQELQQLRSQQKKDRRDADEVTHIMVTECQQLLRLFGLPYITAPMEAEAQCAELVSLGLVDGIVTDDSDVFLFGGTRVYKNMFNQAKYVECYLTSDLEKEYALDRQKLIRFAHLLGSDYTEGIPGIGPVTALEILTEFPTLEEFRDWWSKVQMAAKIPDDAHSAFRKKFKKKATKLFLPPAFPDKRVDVAYLEPEVDSDPSVFQWGVPDLDALRQFLMATIGWSPERTDEVLVPVIRDVNRREQEGTQSNITAFFTGPQGAGAFAPRRRTDGQTRMEKAFGRLRQEAEVRRKGASSEKAASSAVADATERDDDERRPIQVKAKPSRKVRRRPAKGGEGDESADEDEETVARSTKKKRRRP
jgi:DNA excision repair protein ERCC-5